MTGAPHDEERAPHAEHADRRDPHAGPRDAHAGPRDAHAPGGDAGRGPRIAVIGMALRFPGADCPEEFWENIRDGRVSLRRFTEAELDAAGVPAAVHREPDFVGAGGPLRDIAGFDAAYFGMSGREATLTDPQHRMFLECCAHALEDSGYPQERGGLRTGVYATTGYHLYPMRNYLLNNVVPGGGDGDDWVSRMQTMVGNHTDFTATRVSYRLNLTGPSVSVQAGCSSGLLAVQLAAQALLAGDTDLAVAGATAVHVPQVLGYRHVKGSILSRTGELRAFDARSDGTVGGTGVAAVVLKRLDAALADGDTVHAVLRGWGVVNDGADKSAYAAPSAAGQYAAIRAALERAGVDAGSVGYLETHGTGTFKGDPIEFEAATRAFRDDTARTGYCALGAVKANIGHLDVAAGLAGLIKAVLVLRHRTIPPMANLTAPNPTLDLAASPFVIPGRARPWPAPEGGAPRRAGVTSLGVGGTNVHMVVEEAPPPAARPAGAEPPGLLPLSGADPAALRSAAGAMAARLRRAPRPALADLVTTAALGRRHHTHRLVARGGTPDALADALEAYLAGAPAPVTEGVADAPARTALVFSGQGGAHRGMARELYGRFAVVREVLDVCDGVYREERGAGLLPLLLADPSGRPDAAAPLVRTAEAQPALYAVQCALAALWASLGIHPVLTAGHSLGEYAALHAAGALPLRAGMRLTTRRGQLMDELGAPGAMVAVETGREEARRLASGGVTYAVENGPLRHVLAGAEPDVEALCATLAGRGVPFRRLAVDRAFHTPLLEPALDGLRPELEAAGLRPLTVPFVGGLDGRTRPVGWLPDADYLLRQAREPVRFPPVLRALASGADVLLEAGPGAALSALAAEVVPDAVAVPSARRGQGARALGEAVAALHCAGAPLDWAALLAGCGGGRIPLPGYPFGHRTYWTGPPPSLDAPPQPTPPTPPTPPTSQLTEESTGMDKREATERVGRQIIDVSARHLGCAARDVTPDTSFFDLGADSLQMINVLRELEQRYGVRVAMRELFEEATTPRLLAELITARAPEQAAPAPETPSAPVPATAPLATPVAPASVASGAAAPITPAAQVPPAPPPPYAPAPAPLAAHADPYAQHGHAASPGHPAPGAHPAVAPQPSGLPGHPAHPGHPGHGPAGWPPPGALPPGYEAAWAPPGMPTAHLPYAPGGYPGAGYPQPPVPAADWATRAEVSELTRQVAQLAQIQVQLMGQLSQVLGRGAADGGAGR